MADLATTPRLRGSSAVKEAPDSPKLEKAGREVYRLHKKFTGPWQACLDAAPEPGDAISGWTGMVIRAPVQVSRTEGDHAVLEYQASNEPITEPISSEPEPSQVLEIEWTQIVKPLESHSRYFGTGAPMLLDDADLNAIHAWRSETDAAKRTVLRAALSSHAADFATKVERGQESYVLYSPVARRTTFLTNPVATGSCGYRSTPPSEINLSGYEYLKTADRQQSTGRYWQRVEEWTGADSWDHDIYKETSSVVRPKTKRGQKAAPFKTPPPPRQIKNAPAKRTHRR